MKLKLARHYLGDEGFVYEILTHMGSGSWLAITLDELNENKYIAEINYANLIDDFIVGKRLEWAIDMVLKEHGILEEEL